MGLAYYRVTPAVLETVRPLIVAHEAEIVGPRARGYWVDRPEDYDYEGVQRTARQLDQAGKTYALDQLELSEVQAHSLSLLDVALPRDDAEFPPSLFMTSVDPDTLRVHLKIVRRKLGPTPEVVIGHLGQGERDPRFAGYLDKQLRHLREGLPLVWHFHEMVAEKGDAILVVDLRARDLEIPDSVELQDIS